MIVAKYIKSNRDRNGKLTSYTLMDLEGNYKTVNPQQLKDAIKTDKIVVVNMKITDSGRLQEKSLTEAEEKLLKIYKIVNSSLNYEPNHASGFDPVYSFEEIDEEISRYFDI